MKLFEPHGRIRLTLFTKSLVCLLMIFLLQAVVNYWFIAHNEFADTQQKLENLNQRVKDDLKFTDGTWDVVAYNADVFTPNPTGSGGFPTTLYVITKEGLVLERNNPVHGLLDQTKYQDLLKYQTPQTITTTTHEQWRVLTYPLSQGDSQKGVIFASYHAPQEENIAITDDDLKSAVKTISQNISFDGELINVSKVDIRNINYRISFEIVDGSNQVLLNNGRLPAVMDSRNFFTEVNNQIVRIVNDAKTGEPYLISHKKITDEKGETVGIIVSGHSILSTQTLLKKYILFTSITSVGLIIIIWLSFVYAFRDELARIVDIRLHLHQQDVGPQSISFQKATGTLLLDSRSFVFPLDTNQYHLLKEVFTQPKKSVPENHLLTLIGEKASKENWRIIYNALLAVNKKTGLKLVTYQDRSYRLNQDFLNVIYM